MNSIESSVFFLPCKNLEETKLYYTEVLGLGIYQHTQGNLILDTHYGYLGFVQYGDGRPMATGVCLSFNCPDRPGDDAWYEALRGRPECQVQGPPAHHAQFPVYSFFLKDPNGYTLEFQKLDEEASR